jgi:hypothetical protein
MGSLVSGGNLYTSISFEIPTLKTAPFERGGSQSRNTEKKRSNYDKGLFCAWIGTINPPRHQMVYGAIPECEKDNKIRPRAGSLLDLPV